MRFVKEVLWIAESLAVTGFILGGLGCVIAAVIG